LVLFVCLGLQKIIYIYRNAEVISRQMILLEGMGINKWFHPGYIPGQLSGSD